MRASAVATAQIFLCALRCIASRRARIGSPGAAAREPAAQGLASLPQWLKAEKLDAAYRRHRCQDIEFLQLRSIIRAKSKWLYCSADHVMFFRS
jgi:hypothetical protein